MEVIEPARASGSPSRRLARPLRRSAGPADSAPESASRRPAPRTKSRWNGKKLPTIGTNSTPPPTPASTAKMPMTKLTANSASGHSHHGGAPPSAAIAGAAYSRIRKKQLRGKWGGGRVAAARGGDFSRYPNPMPKLAANVSTLFKEVGFLERFSAAASAGFRAVEYQYPYEWPAQ